MTDVANFAVVPVPESRSQIWSREVLKFIRTKPLGAIGGFIVLFFIILALFANITIPEIQLGSTTFGPYSFGIAPYDPLTTDYARMMSPPSWKHWFGTDDFGRDILTRLIYGARTAMSIGLIASFVGSTLGLIIGVASAFYGGRIDTYTQRIIDIFISFPIIILALAIVSIFSGSEFNTVKVMVAIIIPFIPRCARVVRSSALSLREVPYVDAARALGFKNSRIIMRHMLPNVMAPYLIMLTSYMGAAVLLEASLAFLGLGVQEPTPAWGLMLQGNAELFAESAPWMALFPGFAITLSVFGFNLFGDSLRDVLDPKLRI